MKKANKRSWAKSPVFWIIAMPLLGLLLLFAAQLTFMGIQKLPARPTPTQTPVENTPSPSPDAAKTPAQTPSPTPAPPPPPTPYIRRLPTRIYFTKPGLESKVHPLGVVDGAIGTVDSASDCAWYNKSAVPLEEGNCIISGHDRWAGEEGVFAWLKKAKIGDEIKVELDNGEMVYYTVSEKGEYPYDEFPRYHLYTGGEARLTLITCKGDYSAKAGTSLTRVVVVCVPA